MRSQALTTVADAKSTIATNATMFTIVTSAKSLPVLIVMRCIYVMSARKHFVMNAGVFGLALNATSLSVKAVDQLHFARDVRNVSVRIVEMLPIAKCARTLFVVIVYRGRVRSVSVSTAMGNKLD